MVAEFRREEGSGEVPSDAAEWVKTCLTILLPSEDSR